MEACTKEQFERNCTKLIERFCHISFLANPFSIKESTDPTKKLCKVCEELHSLQDLSSETSLNDVDSIYVYGLGLGLPYLQLKKWLEEKKERDLIFIEEDMYALTLFLHTKLAQKVLEHPSIHIEYFSSSDELHGSIQELSEKYPVPSPLILSIKEYEEKEEFSFIRKEILKKTTLSEAIFCDRLNAHHHFPNFLKNVKQLQQSYYANEWKGSFKNFPAIICGAGPSLDMSIPQLKKLQDKALIIAGGSGITALSVNGVTPHIGMAIDPNPEESERMKASCAFEMPIIYATRVHADIFSTMNGPSGYIRSGIGGLSELWIDEELGLADSLVGENLPQESMSVTMMALAYAQSLGCNPIILTGVDLAYHKGKRYPSGVVSSNVMVSSDQDKTPARDELFNVMGINDEELTTAVRWMMEKEAISIFAKEHPGTTFYNATKRGLIIPELTHLSLEKIFDLFKGNSSGVQRDVSGYIHQLVQTSLLNAQLEDGTQKIPHEKVEVLLSQVEESLSQCLSLTKSIINEIRAREATFLASGRLALFQMELKEEIAYSFLLYDVEHILDRFLERVYKKSFSKEEVAIEKWSHIKRILEEYLEQFSAEKRCVLENKTPAETVGTV